MNVFARWLRGPGLRSPAVCPRSDSLDFFTRAHLHLRVRRVFVVCACVAAIGSGSSCPSRAAGGMASDLGAEVPWTVAHSIWFFSNHTEIDRLETAKFTALATWVGKHPGSEVGIHAPTGTVDPESSQAGINQSRVTAIRDALIAAGIPESRIQVGAYGNLLSAVDRRVVVFVRSAPADGVPGLVN